jgi:hypothetical protein
MDLPDKYYHRSAKRIVGQDGRMEHTTSTVLHVQV